MIGEGVIGPSRMLEASTTPPAVMFKDILVQYTTVTLKRVLTLYLPPILKLEQINLF